MELFLEREVDFDRRCRFGDIDLVRLPLELSLLLDVLPELLFFSLGLLFSVLFSILGIMSGNS